MTTKTDKFRTVGTLNSGLLFKAKIGTGDTIYMKIQNPDIPKFTSGNDYPVWAADINTGAIKRFDPCEKVAVTVGEYGGIRSLQKTVHDNAKKHGWWVSDRPVPEILCLIHSEVSEALEAYRNGDDTLFAEELADVAIRLLDAAEGFNIDLNAEILKKHEINKQRSFRHGGKKC